MLVMTNLRAVLFDLDGTLLDRRNSFETFVRHQFKRFGDRLQNVEQNVYVSAVIELDADGYRPRRELFALVARQFGLSTHLTETLLTDYHAGFPAACRLYADAIDTLSSLRATGLKLGLITNGSIRMQSGKIDCLGLQPLFDTILISDKEGVAKPEPEIFHRGVSRLGVEPPHAAFVGDHPEVDIAGARGAGLRAVWRRNGDTSGAVQADAVINELNDLLPLILQSYFG